MQTCSIFLASSSELADDREAFEILVQRRNDLWAARGVRLRLVIWEDFIDAVSPTRLQDEYNRAIGECDIFVMMYSSKVGPFTAEEFQAALDRMQATGKPRIYTYFKPAQISTDNIDLGALAGLQAFRQRLKDLGHYETRCETIDALKLHFSNQLDKLAAEGVIPVGAGAAAAAPARPPPFQAPAPAPDHVPRPMELAALKLQLLDANGKKLLPHTVGLHGFGGVGKTTLARLFCADPAVRAACTGGIVWLPIGKNPPDPLAQIADLLEALTGERRRDMTPGHARASLAEALAGRAVLLVIDDVWDASAIADLAEASIGCARLVTTRDSRTLPVESRLVDVGTMRGDDARQLLGAGLPGGEESRLLALASRLGAWPVLLRLVNRSLRLQVQQQNTPLPEALDAVEADFAGSGVVAFDPAQDVRQRDEAVAATVRATLDLLAPAERQCYAALAVFPQGVPIPLERAAELWQLAAGLGAAQARKLVSTQLDPLALLDFDGAARVLRLHDVLRAYLLSTLADRAGLHLALVRSWGDRPSPDNTYGWRWAAYHAAQAALASPQPARHEITRRLVALVTGAGWQGLHEDALADLPALRLALGWALDAAVADDSPAGVPLTIEAAHALVRFQREQLRPEPIFTLAADGDLQGALRRCTLFTLDDHWRQALLLLVAWAAPLRERDAARRLCDEVRAELGPQQPLHDLMAWVRADLWGGPAPDHPAPVLSGPADDAVIEALLKRVGGGEYDHELIHSRGLDPGARNPDGPAPTRGVWHSPAQATTRYLAELDGPYLVAHAFHDEQKGSDALNRYLSVYTNYGYAEYRFSTLWRLLGHVLRFPRPTGGSWVRGSVRCIAGAALGGGSVEFERGLPIALEALRATGLGASDAQQRLERKAHELIGEAARIKPGRDRGGSDIWGHHKRQMLVHAEAFGWLLCAPALADELLHDALGLADSGFAGYQAPACEALAEALLVCGGGGAANRPAIDEALGFAQRAAHNVQDPTFCARMTARVNAFRLNWWRGFDLEERARHLLDAAPLPELAALHHVGHSYAGRREDAIEWPEWATDDRSIEGLAQLYQRPRSGFVRLNRADLPLAEGQAVAVPDPGFAPQLAARLSAEILVRAGPALPSDPRPLPAPQLQLLRALVPLAVPSPTALDMVLARLVLAQGRRRTPLDAAELDALQQVLPRWPEDHDDLRAAEELIATAVHPGRVA